MILSCKTMLCYLMCTSIFLKIIVTDQSDHLHLLCVFYSRNLYAYVLLQQFWREAP